MQQEETTDLRQRKSKKLDIRYGPVSFHAYNEKDLRESLPHFVGYAFIILLLIIIKCFHIFENNLPDQIRIKDADLHAGRFIGERAELQLKRLTSLGPRVVGSYENEVLAVDFLQREVSFIKQEANKMYKIEIDIQKPTGSFSLLLKPHSFRNYYANIQNFVVKLSSGNSTNSILLNCHYDSVIGSPGASDNALNCAVLLETLRVLATGKTPLKNNVIFLFNGAEENAFQASHGFVSQQKWSKEVKVVINLDSCGAGGKEVLFQTSGQVWLVKAFAYAVPRPTAGVQGEELFLYGIVPSDTDFRIFRDFGHYSGFDFAHWGNGYVYHTKFDKMDYVHPGVYQNTGDNLLALLRHLINSSEVGKNHSQSQPVYFDVFSLFVIVYSEELGTALNLLAVVLSVFTAYKTLENFTGGISRNWKKICVSVGAQTIGLLLSAAFVFLTSEILDLFNSTMSWYLRPWLIIPLYSFPVGLGPAVVVLATESFLRKDLLKNKIIILLIGAQLIWTFLLLLGTLKGIRSSYIIMFFVLLTSVGSLVVIFFKKPFSANAYLLSYACSLSLPTLFLLAQAVRVFLVIVPMTARMGPNINPERIIGSLALLISAIYLSFIMPYVLLIRNFRKFLLSVFVFHAAVMTLVITTKVGFPYDGDIRSPAFQRFIILHCDRTFHDAKGMVRKSDSGIFVQSLDRNDMNYVSRFLPELKNARLVGDDCPKEMFCGFPIFTSRFVKPAPYSYWIPAASPTIHHPTSLEVVNQTQISVNIRRMRLLVTGPDHVTIGLSPMIGVNLVKWSFGSSPPIEIYISYGRKVYMVYYSHGLVGGTLEFDVDLEIGQHNLDHVMDVVVIGHYVNDKKFQTEELKKLLSKFPDWAHITSWTTTYKSWVV